MFAGANVNACHLDLCNNPPFSAGRTDLVQRGERQRFYRHRTQTGAPALHLQHGVNENITSFFLFFIMTVRYGPVTLKDNSATSLADNKYHTVWIRRPSRKVQVN